jgi:hypothetical protein
MRGNFWTVIGSIAGVLAVIFTVWFFLQGRSEQSKKLEIELIARSILVDETVSRAKQRVEILYDGRKISNYVILQLRVANTGGQSIRHTDYEEHFWLHFGNVMEILSAEQVSSDPTQLQIKPALCSPDCQSVGLPPVLLNPRDWYILEVGAAAESGKKPTIEPKGRIAGVKHIVFKETIPPPTKERNQDPPEWYYSLIGSVLLILAIFGLKEFYQFLEGLIRRWREIKHQ